eukprot:TRINITY_DN98319_c0_g1_i1.p1 TRINITY_DN98319_c0_g1~~TRINITY_DN98319_c0_g1_i1.p1  ORF type:complete len:613 (-),score=91.09 TRINITY_DN98319_c0_g1_i1:41-1879(-)
MADAILIDRDDAWVHSSAAMLSATCAPARVRHRADTIYLVVMAGRVIAMQSGFGMLESACSRPMNAANVMMKNVYDMFLGILAYWFVGHGIAWGHSSISWEEDAALDWAFWFIQFSYCTTASTIASGALAGRVSFTAYLLLSLFITSLVYPTVVQWAWGGGWLQELGFIDFAGGGVVHLVGAMCALASVGVCGPRIGRFPDYRTWRGIWRYVFVERYDDSYYQGPRTELERKVHSGIKECFNPVQMLFGLFLLFNGFLAFNPGSTFSTTKQSDLLVARTTVTTMMVTGAGSATVLFMSFLRRRSLVISVPDLANAAIGSMVASCGCCHVIPLPMTLVVGVVAALLTDCTHRLVTRLQYDDVVAAFAVHGPTGIFGVLCVPLFARPHCGSELRGLAFGGGEQSLKLLGIQVAGVTAISAFSFIATHIIVVAIDLLIGFRSHRADELIGLDFSEHNYESSSGPTIAKHEAEALFENSPVRPCLLEVVRQSASPSKSYQSKEPPESRTNSEHQVEEASKASEAESQTNGEHKGGEASQASETQMLKLKVAALEDQLARLTSEFELVAHLAKKAELGRGSSIVGEPSLAQSSHQASDLHALHAQLQEEEEVITRKV